MPHATLEEYCVALVGEGFRGEDGVIILGVSAWNSISLGWVAHPSLSSAMCMCAVLQRRERQTGGLGEEACGWMLRRRQSPPWRAWGWGRWGLLVRW